MPDITYPNTITAGSTTSASDIAENLFKPKYTPDNLEVLNRLDRTNLSGPGGQFVTRDMVRPGQFVVGGMTGHTANRDYFKQAYPGGWTVTNMTQAAEAATPVAGLCKTQRIDFVPTIFMVNWGFSVIIDDGSMWANTAEAGRLFSFSTGTTTGHHTSIHLFVNGVQVTQANYHLAHSERTLAQLDPTVTGLTPNTAKAFRQDSRYIFGHFLFDSTNTTAFASTNTPLRAGLHTAELRIASKRRLVRFKTSNISILAMR